jgi:hypothetical protein
MLVDCVSEGAVAEPLELPEIDSGAWVDPTRFEVPARRVGEIIPVN